jgi:hypothetical protein
MSEGWKEVASEIGKRLLQVMVVVMAEEIVRRSFKSAYLDDDTVVYEKPRLKKATVKTTK